jgi:hypothetical protein
VRGYPSRRPSSRVLALGLSTAVALVAGCAISSDPEPRRIDAADVPYDLLNPTTAPPASLAVGVPTEDAVIYLADEKDRRVTPVLRSVPRPLTLDQRLLQLVETRPSEKERDEGISNVITRHTRIREVRQEEIGAQRRVIIDLDRFFPGLGSDDVSLAIAQVVFTVDDHYAGSEVEFRVDGQPESIRTGGGTALDVVTTEDFIEFRADTQENGETPSSTTADGSSSDSDGE